MPIYPRWIHRLVSFSRRAGMVHGAGCHPVHCGSGFRHCSWNDFSTAFSGFPGPVPVLSVDVLGEGRVATAMHLWNCYLRLPDEYSADLSGLELLEIPNALSVGCSLGVHSFDSPRLRTTFPTI